MKGRTHRIAALDVRTSVPGLTWTIASWSCRPFLALHIASQLEVSGIKLVAGNQVWWERIYTVDIGKCYKSLLCLLLFLTEEGREREGGGEREGSKGIIRAQTKAALRVKGEKKQKGKKLWRGPGDLWDRDIRDKRCKMTRIRGKKVQLLRSEMQKKHWKGWAEETMCYWIYLHT